MQNLTYISTGASQQPSGDFDCNENNAQIIEKRKSNLYPLSFPDDSGDCDGNTLLAAEMLASSGKYYSAFDSLRVFCEKNYMYTYPHQCGVSVPGAFRDAAGYATAVYNNGRGPSDLLYSVYNWLVTMQPKNNDCKYYQDNLMVSLANLLGVLDDPNEKCNMFWNLLQLCPDGGRHDSLIYYYIKREREAQREHEPPIDTTPFYLYSYPLKQLQSAVTERYVPEMISAVHISPNPASDESKLRFTLSEPCHIDISLNDILGREMKKLYYGRIGDGNAEIPIRTNDIPSGTYTIRLQYGDYVLTQVLVVRR